MIPLTIALEGRRVLVVGAGAVGLGKAARLVAAGCAVEVVATEILGPLPDGLSSFERRPFQEDDLDGAWLVVSATGDREVDDRIFAAAAERRVLCNVVDDPARSDVFFPAVHRDGPVTVAVSTGGLAPSLAVWIRDRISEAIPPGLGRVARAIGREREELREQGLSTEGRPWRQRIESLLARCVRLEQD